MQSNARDDFKNRFRSTHKPSPQPRIISDFTAAAARPFPTIGVTLPPRFAQARPQPEQPRQPLARQASVDPVRPPSRIAQPKPAVAKPARRRRRIITRGRIALLVVLIIFALGGWLGSKLIVNAQKVFHGSIFSILTTTKLKGEDTGRVNILLAGNSADDPGHDGANLTDSIMLLSIDVKNKSGFMLSIPRDLWVDIPGYGHAKINEAYVDGEAGNFSAPGYPNGGMGLLEEVIQQDLGIKADYYALVGYSALRDSVNAVGGIDVDIQSVDPRGLYDPSIDFTTHGPLVKLRNGVQHLDGEQALDLARARGDAYGSYGFPSSDFDRTEHQRMIILAIKQKALTLSTLANPVTLANLFDSIGQNVKTDFTLGEVRRAYDLSKTINNNSVQSVGLNDAAGVNLLANYTSPTNQSALIPRAGIDDYSAIQAFIARLTSSNLVVREGANVVLLNGTATSGLAGQTQAFVTSKGITVSAIGDAQSQSATTTIIDVSNGQKPATLKQLEQIFGKHVTTTNPYAATYQADFIIILGSDWRLPSSST